MNELPDSRISGYLHTILEMFCGGMKTVLDLGLP